ncbi:MAG: GGDEF domain-containing protein [Lachnospiraceae bacterium]|nr:GGDEF domain-containing protein [Lachnospiraceae bacterium]
MILGHNLFEALRNRITEAEWEESYADFQSNTEGTLTFDLGEAEETLCYVPVKDTGWEMVVLIRESVIRDQIRSISERNLAASRHQIGFTFVSVLALALVLIHQLRKLSKEKLEEEKETSRTFQNMANTDAMTGVRNKLAYSENEAAIDSQIEAGEIEHLGVVIGDINGLKYVNDTIGHAAGDQLIKDACNLICSCFKQGAVFRIGGDEFAVILQGKGFDSMSEAISELNRIVEENIKTDEVVVSIGYSTYGPDDKRLSDIFERADKMMYERKSELKSMGAQTRR